MVIHLLGVKTRCADKSAAEHYEHTYIHRPSKGIDIASLVLAY